MPSVAELTGLYANVLLNPRPGPWVCETCFTLTDGYQRCYACQHAERTVDVVAPISYSVAGEQLHHALAGYKRFGGDGARRMQAALAALLWRFLADHEPCIATATRVPSFPLVTTVPSSSRDRDERHPLRHIVGEIVLPTRDRYERLLTRSNVQVEDRTISAEKYEVAEGSQASPCCSSTTPGPPEPTPRALPPHSVTPAPAGSPSSSSATTSDATGRTTTSDCARCRSRSTGRSAPGMPAGFDGSQK
jgi:hypothetical protein